MKFGHKKKLKTLMLSHRVSISPGLESVPGHDRHQRDGQNYDS